MNSIPSVSSYFNVTCNIEKVILGITDDSRDVKNGYLFVARAGVNSHGINFIDDAISNGALCNLCSIRLGLIAQNAQSTI